MTVPLAKGIHGGFLQGGDFLQSSTGGAAIVVVKRFLLCCLLAISLSPGLGPVCEAGLTVYDDVAPEGEVVTLRAQATGRLFPLGGVLVDLYVDGEKIGTNLTGGDGYLFREFRPRRRGLYTVSAVYRGMSGEGALLVLEKGAEIVFVDVLGSMIKDLLRGEAREGCRAAVEKIAGRYPVVFLSAGLGTPSMLKTWLREEGFDRAVVVPWDDGQAFAEAVRNGFLIRAVIGSPGIVESAGERARERYSFEDVEGATKVRAWSEIGEKIR